MSPAELLAIDAGPRASEEMLAVAYAANARAVLGLASRLVGDRMLAEEVTQEVFLRLWRRPERFDATRGSLRSFLLAECHGRSIDALRSESARRRREAEDGRSVRARPEIDVARDVCDAAVSEQVEGLIQNLPLVEREAISLAYCDHLTYREVAVVLDAPEGTVKGRIRSGLRRMRSQMDALGVEAP